MSSEQTDWTSKKLLNWMRERFEASGVDASRVVAETLLAGAFDCSRLELHMHPDRPASGEERDRLRDQVRRILSGEPLHYVTGKAQFWHGSFAVRPCTQIPQPCTELLVSHTLGLLSSRGQTVGHGRRAVDSLPAVELGAEQDPHQAGSGDTALEVDASFEHESEENTQSSTDQSSDQAVRILELGVGSGAVIVSLLHSLPSATGVGVDVEDDCLALAQENAHTHAVADRLTLQRHDVSAPLPGAFDVVVGNLPYIPDHEWPQSIDPGVLEFTPERALRGGEDGLAIIRPVLGWVGQVMRPNGLLGLEHAACSDQAVADLLENAGFQEVESISDEDGFPRVTFGVWSGEGR